MMAKRSVIAWLTAFVIASAVFVSPASADFGLSGFDVTFTNQDGSPDTQAGSHPFAMTTRVALNTVFDSELGSNIPAGDIKDLLVGQIPGLVGDAGAVPECKTADFLHSTSEKITTSCPDSTAVGTITLRVSSNGEPTDEWGHGAVYNLEPPPGVAAELGFIAVIDQPVLLDVGVNDGSPYNLVGSLKDVPEPIRFYESVLTLWGDPADPAHDPLRGNCVATVEAQRTQQITSRGECPSNAPNRPFLTLPTSCTGPASTVYQADSWEAPGAWVFGSSLTHDNAEPSNPDGMTGCGRLAFKPTIEARPTTLSAQSPTGLDFSLDVTDAGLTSPTGLAQSEIKKTVVTLPEGMTANPAVAEGLGVCSEEELARETAVSLPGEGCPQASKIGTVEVHSPLLEEALSGSIYMATPYKNPSGGLLELYFVIRNAKLGIVVKQPAKIEPDPVTGRLTTVVDDIPQLPFSHFTLHFRSGARTPLVSPPVCGAYQVTAQLTPWSEPELPIETTSSFDVISGPDGSACPPAGIPPFDPKMVGGTLDNAAGSYSPLYLRIVRNDGEQEITGFSSLLPPGLTANLNGVPFCSEAQIASAKTKSGAQEQAEASCPQASEIGHTLVGAGVGSVLAYTPGKLYMAGPFEGAPFSVVAITSAKVGPFDLGTVVVHLPLNINPVTAEVSIPAGAADQIPHIIKGVVVHVRDIRVYVDRPSFTLNPTSCNPLTFNTSVIGAGQNFASAADDVAASVNDPFQAANCANLGFKPSFKVTTAGKTSRKNGASLNVKLAYPKAPQGTQANIKSVKVDLPKQLPSRLTTLQKACTADQFEANPAGCPSASRVGQAKAITPILPVPIAGPAYFVSHGGAKFPELVLVLQGYGVIIDLHGETFINKAGITSSTFHAVPDQPVASFELTLPQGPNSALAANGDLCSMAKTVLVKRKMTVRVKGHEKTITRKVRKTLPESLTMPTTFTAQNGAVIHQNTSIGVTGCVTAKRAKTRGRAKQQHRK